MAGADLLDYPLALARGFYAFVHRLDHHEALAFGLADALDVEAGRGLEHYSKDVVSLGAAAEEGDHVEPGFLGHGRSGEEQRERAGEGKPHWRPATSASTMVGSASVDVSPKPSVAPSAILRRIRRMILPDRVFGSDGVKWIFSGAENAPMSWRTSWINSLRISSLPSS